MNKDSFYVLHISDLHIQKASRTKPYYQNALKELIDDICLQTKDVQNIVVVVSGDILDRGDYANAASAALCFLKTYTEKFSRKQKIL